MKNAIYDYLLSDEQREYLRYNKDTPAYMYSISGGMQNLKRGIGKFHMFLYLSDKIKSMEFNNNEMEEFSNAIHTYFDSEDLCLDTLKSYSIEGLLEQSIVIMVSNMEQYFVTTFEIILNDAEFIKKKKDNPEFNQFLKFFRIFPNQNHEIQIDNSIKLGTYIVENQKISFQELKTINKLFKYLFEINVKNFPHILYSKGSQVDYQVQTDDWLEFHKLFDARHMIVHSTKRNITNIKAFAKEVKCGLYSINQIYTIDKLNELKIRIDNMLHKIDERLFTVYDRNYIP